MENKQTSIEYIIEQLQAPCRGIPSHIIIQAKEMYYNELQEMYDEGGKRVQEMVIKMANEEMNKLNNNPA
jgi:hypothetical protein